MNKATQVLNRCLGKSINNDRNSKNFLGFGKKKEENPYGEQRMPGLTKQEDDYAAEKFRQFIANKGYSREQFLSLSDGEVDKLNKEFFNMFKPRR